MGRGSLTLVERTFDVDAGPVEWFWQDMSQTCLPRLTYLKTSAFFRQIRHDDINEKEPLSKATLLSKEQLAGTQTPRSLGEIDQSQEGQVTNEGYLMGSV